MMYRPHKLNREEREARRQKLNAMDTDEMDATEADVTAETMPDASSHHGRVRTIFGRVRTILM